MQLQSEKMALNHEERHWLPWFGKTGKLTMRWACHCNRDRLTAMESAFNSFAQTRKELLTQWCEQQWSLLASLPICCRWIRSSPGSGWPINSCCCRMPLNSLSLMVRASSWPALASGRSGVLVLPLVSGRLFVGGVVCMVPTRMS